VLHSIQGGRREEGGRHDRQARQRVARMRPGACWRNASEEGEKVEKDAAGSTSSASRTACPEVVVCRQVAGREGRSAWSWQERQVQSPPACRSASMPS